MYVVMVAPECAPAAKAGGLGDVVSGLSRELELRGNAVEIILPKYASVRYSDIWDLRPSYHDLWVPWYDGAVRCTVWFGYGDGRKCFFIEPHSAADFFGRERLYGYGDDAERFAFFSKAALEFMLRAGKRPDVIHCHDWQTGLVPVLLFEQYSQVMPDQRVCYTIHNFRYQGTSDEQVLWATGLGRPDYFLDADRLGDDFRYRRLNPMKGGILYSNFVTTVSQNHAGEALFDDGAFGRDAGSPGASTLTVAEYDRVVAKEAGMSSENPVRHNRASDGGQPGPGAVPQPLRHFADRLAELRSADVLDMDQVGRLLVELAGDEEFFGPLIAQIPSGSPGTRWLIRPERGPRLVLVHRPDGVMGYTHSHRCWVGIAPVRGVETHQRWDAIRHTGGRAELRLADERALVRGDAATLVPPRDVHNHGHVPGSGPSPYSLILLGDDMLLFEREEYDPERGTWRTLAPGDPGRDNR